MKQIKSLSKISIICGCFLSVLFLMLLHSEVSFRTIIYHNISSFGYEQPIIFVAWCTATALFYLNAILNFVVLFDIKIKKAPVILSICAFPCLMVTAFLLPETDVELFIHCGFAFAFCLLNYIAVSILFVALYKKQRTLFTKLIAIIFPCLSVVFIGLLIWQPMWGITELLPLFFTMLLLLFFILFYKPKKDVMEGMKNEKLK